MMTMVRMAAWKGNKRAFHALSLFTLLDCNQIALRIGVQAYLWLEVVVVVVVVVMVVAHSEKTDNWRQHTWLD